MRSGESPSPPGLGRAILGFLGVAAAYLASLWLVSILLAALGGPQFLDVSTKPFWVLILEILIDCAFLTAIAVIASALLNARMPSLRTWPQGSVFWVSIPVAIGIALTLFADPIETFTIEFLSFPKAVEDPFLERYRSMPGWQQVVLVMLTASVIPVAEEWMYRGFIYSAFLGNMGRVGAALISSAVFGLVHLEASMILFGFISGLAFSCLRAMSGSLYPAVIAHAFYNAATMIWVVLL